MKTDHTKPHSVIFKEHKLLGVVAYYF